MPVDHAKIKLLREKLGLSQAAAATATGLGSRQHWNNIESGRQSGGSISVELLERVAATLGVKAADLLK